MEQNKFYQIKNITEYEYTLVGCDGSVTTFPIQEVDKSASAFNIQDVSDGDVLSYRDGQWIFIYKKQVDDNSFHYYSLYSTIHQDLTIDDSAFTLLIDGIIPATQEQRNILFQKMKESGYEWDAEKKELKRVEQKPAEWSEEDDYVYNEILKRVADKKLYEHDLEYIYTWLKFIRPQKQGKPTDEQIKTCKEVYADILSAKGFDLGTVNSELNRLEEQLKKL